MIVSRCSGSLTILSVADSELVNLFGTHSEWSPPFTLISPAFDERFYHLEVRTGFCVHFGLIVGLKD